MRSIAMSILVLSLSGQLLAQELDVPPRFEVLHNAELYKQDTPQNTLDSVLVAASRDRFDYVIAHLLDPALVDARLATNQVYFERVANEQVGATAAGQLLMGEELYNQVRRVAVRLNVKQLGDQMRRKLADEPNNLRELKQIARDGQFEAAGETAKATHKDLKGRALYFKKIGNRWFLENFVFPSLCTTIRFISSRAAKISAAYVAAASCRRSLRIPETQLHPTTVGFRSCFL
jgi:hypothetical protein